MTARAHRQRGRDDYLSLMDIIGAASAIEGIIDCGTEHPLVVESLVIAERVLRRTARMDAPDPESARDAPAGASAAPEADLVDALRLLDRLLDNPALVDPKMREPIAIVAALVERAFNSRGRKRP
jgi:hypothetical protein